MPDLLIIAGPPGGGKSTAYPVRDSGYAFFNADDRAAELNGGSYRAISPSIRARVNKEFEEFISRHIRERRSLAFETTLRTDITLRQAAEAKRQGFNVVMKYVAHGTLEDHLERVASRADAGGHAASETTLRKIYEASLKNLPLALRVLEHVEVSDNAVAGASPRLVLRCVQGAIVYQSPDVPAWLRIALQNTEFETK